MHFYGPLLFFISFLSTLSSKLIIEWCITKISKDARWPRSEVFMYSTPYVFAIRHNFLSTCKFWKWPITWKFQKWPRWYHNHKENTMVLIMRMAFDFYPKKHNHSQTFNCLYYIFLSSFCVVVHCSHVFRFYHSNLSEIFIWQCKNKKWTKCISPTLSFVTKHEIVPKKIGDISLFSSDETKAPCILNDEITHGYTVQHFGKLPAQPYQWIRLRSISRRKKNIKKRHELNKWV